MKKNTMYILGGVAVVGLAYYLYNRSKQPSIEVNLPAFANLVGSKDFKVIGQPQKSNVRCGGCPVGSSCAEVQFPNGNYGYRCVDFNAGTIVK
jgi:hypothetical protein